MTSGGYFVAEAKMLRVMELTNLDVEDVVLLAVEEPEQALKMGLRDAVKVKNSDSVAKVEDPRGPHLDLKVVVIRERGLLRALLELQRVEDGFAEVVGIEFGRNAVEIVDGGIEIPSGGHRLWMRGRKGTADASL
jgi:hypothetical protein